MYFPFPPSVNARPKITECFLPSTPCHVAKKSGRDDHDMKTPLRRQESYLSGQKRSDTLPSFGSQKKCCRFFPSGEKWPRSGFLGGWRSQRHRRSGRWGIPGGWVKEEVRDLRRQIRRAERFRHNVILLANNSASDRTQLGGGGDPREKSIHIPFRRPWLPKSARASRTP